MHEILDAVSSVCALVASVATLLIAFRQVRKATASEAAARALGARSAWPRRRIPANCASSR